ncbi:hypothetical protein V5O48_017872 [Marasmius crinis-equi]|uniref:Integrase core domain-containing protein n=1 Tax=Marasmius crinis-equi TaxID=585013 RepID=A0ABR3EMR0_9AGAR
MVDIESPFPELPLFPSSPSHPDLQSYSPNVYAAHSQLKTLQRSASRILSVEEADPLRIQVHIESLCNVIPVIEALDRHKEEEHLSDEWLMEVTALILSTIDQLTDARNLSEDRDQSRVVYPQPVKKIQTGKKGRPRLDIDTDILKKAMDLELSLKICDVARSLSVSTNTLKLRLREAGIDYKFSEISDADLDTITREYRRIKVGSGIQYLVGHIRSAYNLRVQRHRIYESVKRVDGLGIVLNSSAPVARKPYEVQRPLVLFHIDGHCKLILWGIVVHGIADGYSHMIVGLEAHDNNRATTVLELELGAEKAYGRPSRIRGDRGRENKGVALWIIAHNGLNRGSFIWGSHLWLLHDLFLNTINEDCRQFQREWNSHPISRLGKDKSPQQLFFLGQMKKGIYTYEDDCAGLTPQEIQDSYGIHGTPREVPDDFVGAGYVKEDREIDCIAPVLDDDVDTHSDTSEEDKWEDDGWEAVSSALDNKFIDPAHPPKIRNPFAGNQQLENVFRSTLLEATQEGILPEGYGIREEEWEGGQYPSFEKLQTGKKRGGQELRIDLPDEV